MGIGAAALVSARSALATVDWRMQRLGQAMVFGLLIGLILAGLILLVADHISALMNLSGSSVKMAGTYLRVLAIAAPASGILFVANACLRASGDTKTPFRILAIVNFFNVTCSCILVFAPAAKADTAFMESPAALPSPGVWDRSSPCVRC